MCSGAAGVPEITNHKIQNNLENNSAFFYIFSILVRKGKRSLKISIINIGKLMKLTRHRTKPVPSEPYPTDNQALLLPRLNQGRARMDKYTGDQTSTSASKTEASNNQTEASTARNQTRLLGCGIG